MRGSSIGARRAHFVLELPVETPDGFGGVARNWQAGFSLWGAIALIRGEERWRSGGEEQAATHRITVRFREDVTAGMRLRLGTRLFDLRSIADPDGARRILIGLAEEVSV